MYAETRAQAERGIEAFVAEFSPKYERAVDCLIQDSEALLAFFDFPAEHWKHLRTSNPIESSFATVRLRQREGAGSRAKALTMAFKLLMLAKERWRKLNGSHLLPLVRAGVPLTVLKSNAVKTKKIRRKPPDHASPIQLLTISPANTRSSTDLIGDPSLTDEILDRLVHNAYRLDVDLVHQLELQPKRCGAFYG
jgi:hypothetical protein